MRFFSSICGCLAGFIATGFAAGTTALDAVKLLPKEMRARIARIEARDGSPEPERWYILVQDRAAENGLKEFVVADGAIVAERGISQFAERLAPEQMLGDGVRFDSDRAAQIAQQYAQLNDVTAATIAYQLRRDGTAAVPMWRLTCFNAIGREVGSLTITATKGAVISHQGFSIEPTPVVVEKPREKPRAVAVPQIARATAVQQPPSPEPPPPPPKKPGLVERLFGGARQ